MLLSEDFLGIEKQKEFRTFMENSRHPAIRNGWILIQGFRERTEHLNKFFPPSLNGVIFPMFCLLVKGECQILVF